MIAGLPKAIVFSRYVYEKHIDKEVATRKVQNKEHDIEIQEVPRFSKPVKFMPISGNQVIVSNKLAANHLDIEGIQQKSLNNHLGENEPQKTEEAKQTIKRRQGKSKLFIGKELKVSTTFQKITEQDRELETAKYRSQSIDINQKESKKSESGNSVLEKASLNDDSRDDSEWPIFNLESSWECEMKEQYRISQGDLSISLQASDKDIDTIVFNREIMMNNPHFLAYYHSIKKESHAYLDHSLCKNTPRQFVHPSSNVSIEENRRIKEVTR